MKNAHSCGANICVLGSPEGMGTNGPCRCLDGIRKQDGYDKYRRVNLGIIELRKKIEQLQMDKDGYK